MGDISWNETRTKGDFVIGDGANIVITEGAYYKITADTKKMVASLAKTGWEVIGDATAGGWDKSDGDIKFRWDASWTINLGGDLNALTQDGPNIHINAGTYKIVLDANNNTATITAV